MSRQRSMLSIISLSLGSTSTRQPLPRIPDLVQGKHQPQSSTVRNTKQMHPPITSLVTTTPATNLRLASFSPIACFNASSPQVYLDGTTPVPQSNKTAEKLSYDAFVAHPLHVFFVTLRVGCGGYTKGGVYCEDVPSCHLLIVAAISDAVVKGPKLTGPVCSGHLG
jgi:hypothetical protein